jgi:hypothetical protein
LPDISRVNVPGGLPSVVVIEPVHVVNVEQLLLDDLRVLSALLDDLQFLLQPSYLLGLLALLLGFLGQLCPDILGCYLLLLDLGLASLHFTD